MRPVPASRTTSLEEAIGCRPNPTGRGPPTVPPFALHLLHGWWVASCPDCGHELGRSRDQEAAERAGERRRCPICQPTQQAQGVA
jgi:hypothetical protein